MESLLGNGATGDSPNNPEDIEIQRAIMQSFQMSLLVRPNSEDGQETIPSLSDQAAENSSWAHNVSSKASQRFRNGMLIDDWQTVANDTGWLNGNHTQPKLSRSKHIGASERQGEDTAEGYDSSYEAAEHEPQYEEHAIGSTFRASYFGYPDSVSWFSGAEQSNEIAKIQLRMKPLTLIQTYHR